MLFVKKALMGLAAFVLILWGGAGTQSHNTLLQGGGFLGLIIGLIVLYIFAKMAWRAMGCLPSLLIIIAIVMFLLYAIGGFSNGVEGLGNNISKFLGRKATVSASSEQATPGGVVALLEEEDFGAPIDEGFSSTIGSQSEQASEQPKPSKKAEPKAKKIGTIQKIMDNFGGGHTQEQEPAFNPTQFPAIYASANVVSGDTLKINGRYLRLFAIDAPEMNQNCSDYQGRAYGCGRQSAAWLRDWITDNELECRIMQQDANGNMVGTCSLGAYDLGAALVNAGWAVAYVKYADIYVPYEQQAQQNRRGLWQGKFYMPWDWRTLQSKKPKIKVIKPKVKTKGGMFSSF